MLYDAFSNIFMFLKIYTPKYLKISRLDRAKIMDDLVPAFYV